jgi:hypothetical protein
MITSSRFHKYGPAGQIASLTQMLLEDCKKAKGITANCHNPSSREYCLPFAPVVLGN